MRAVHGLPIAPPARNRNSINRNNRERCTTKRNSRTENQFGEPMKVNFSDNIPSRQYCRCISGWTGATCDQQEVQTELYSFFKRTVRLVGLNPGG